LNKTQGGRLALSVVEGEQGARGIVQMGIRPHIYENHLIEVGDSDPYSAPLYGRGKGSLQQSL